MRRARVGVGVLIAWLATAPASWGQSEELLPGEEPPPLSCSSSTVTRTLCSEDLAAGTLVERTSLGTVTDSTGTYSVYFEYSHLAQSPASVGSAAKIGGYPVKCGRAKVSILYEGPFPWYLNMWRYSMRQGRCWNGQKITSLYHFKRWSEYAAYTWEFVGHVDFAKSGCAGCFAAYKFTQGHYKNCPPKIVCVEHRYPWLELTVKGNGAVVRDKGKG